MTEVSVIISTRNRVESLARTLAKLDGLEALFDWEVVVVDNGSTDGTLNLLKETQAVWRRPLRIVEQPRKGLANARNAGVRFAVGNIFAFIDDDCLPEPDYLIALKTIFDEYPELGFAGGRVLLHDPSDLMLTVQYYDKRIDFGADDYLRPGRIHGANMAVRRSVFESGLLFDPLFGSGSYFPAEDVDFMARTQLAGWPGAYDPRLVVLHAHGRKTERERVLLERSYLFGSGAYNVRRIIAHGLKLQAVKEWYWRARKRAWSLLFRELLGAAAFVGLAAIDCNRRFTSAAEQPLECN